MKKKTAFMPLPSEIAFKFVNHRPTSLLSELLISDISALHLLGVEQYLDVLLGLPWKKHTCTRGARESYAMTMILK